MRLVGLLFLFLLCLYLATSSGHTSSNDEDEMYYVTQGIVERHSLALPPDEAQALAIPRGSARATDGNYYSPYGPLQSILAIPLYLGGLQAAAAFDPRFDGFITRAAVTGLPAVATAASAAILALLAHELGLTRANAVFLGLIYGTATIAWPYARSFWSEPLATLLVVLAAYCAVRGSRAPSARAWLLVSLCIGLAVATRSAMLAAIPPMVVYLVAASFRSGGATARRRLVRQALGFGAGFVLPACALGAYNLARFGLAWESGNRFGPSFAAAGVILSDHPLTGLVGLLLSPGKSVLLYSPPLIAALLALPAFVRWARWEALLVLGLAMAQIGLVAPLVFWHGDAAWGPRYLVPAIPFLLLPLAAWLGTQVERGIWTRRLVGSVIALGVLVQVVGSVVNYDVYVLLSGGPEGVGAQRRWFDPLASPLLAAPRQLAERVALYSRTVGRGQYAFATGFFEPESPEAPLPRWSDGHAAIAFRPSTPSTGQANLVLSQPEAGRARPAAELVVRLDGERIAPSFVSVSGLDAGRYMINVQLPESLDRDIHRIELDSPVFTPAQLEPGSADTRRLGVRLLSVSFVFGPDALSLADLPVVPGLPVTAEQPWSRAAFGWFYDPAVPHLVDLWPWYVASSGLPQLLAASVFVILVALMIVGRWMHASLWTASDSCWRGQAGYLIGGITILSVVLCLTAVVGATNPPAIRARASSPPALHAATRFTFG